MRRESTVAISCHSAHRTRVLSLCGRLSTEFRYVLSIGGGAARRDFIYPHRGVRAFPMSSLRLWAGIGLALSITVLSVIYALRIMDAHSRVAGFLAEWGAARDGVDDPSATSLLLDCERGPVQMNLKANGDRLEPSFVRAPGAACTA